MHDPEHVKVTLRMPFELKERLRLAAFDLRLSQTTVIVEAVEAWLAARRYGPDDVVFDEPEDVASEETA